jgi:3-oxoacyl-(acyl-carrier-protein) synthase
VCAAGVGAAELWRSLKQGRGEVAAFDPAADGVPAPPFPAYRVPRGGVEGLLTERDLAELPADPELRLAIASLRLAIADAGLPEHEVSRAALVVTYEAPGMDRLLRGLFRDFLAGRSGGGSSQSPETPEAAFQGFFLRHRDAVYHTHSFLHLHLLARVLGVHGPTLFLNNACASGLHALDAAAGIIRSGKAGVALVAAAEYPLFPTKMLWFEELGIYARSGALRPFDLHPSGVVFGEAGAAMVLEDPEHARRRGARARAEYAGGYSNQEAWKVAVPDLTSSYYEETVRGACAAAGVTPGEIDLVSAHGAATPLSDLYEARGLAAVFGDWPERPPVCCLKPYFGHTLGASALLESCALVLAMEESWIPATPNFTTPDPRLRIAPLASGRSASLTAVLKMANGFAGFNAGAVFRRPR